MTTTTQEFIKKLRAFSIPLTGVPNFVEAEYLMKESADTLEALQVENERLETLAKGQHVELYNARLRLAEIEKQDPAKPQGCACRWDADDNRIATCTRHQGWLDVVQEWADRAKVAEVKLAQPPPPAPSDTAITYMTGYSDCKEWAQTSQADAQDAARYRWLRSTTNWASNSSNERIDVRNSPELWDAAVDAAIQKELTP